MSDITMCKGVNCPVKKQCKRFAAKENPYRQSWFLEPPYEIEAGEFTCHMYWGKKEEYICNQLKKITNK